MNSPGSVARPAVIVLGPPGAGKSTLALGLCARFPRLGHLAPRRFLLEERQKGTELAASAFAILETQPLLPEEFFADVAAELAARGAFECGLVFEGLPVTVRQAELLWDRILGDSKLRVVTFVVSVTESTMHTRAGLRLSCEMCERAGRVAVEIRDADQCPVCGGPLVRRAEDSSERLVARLHAWRYELVLQPHFRAPESGGVFQEAREPSPVVAAPGRALVAPPPARPDEGVVGRSGRAG